MSEIRHSSHSKSFQIKCGFADVSIGDAKHPVYKTDGTRSHTDASNMSTDTLSVETDMLMPTNEAENISIPQMKPKPQTYLVEAQERSQMSQMAAGTLWTHRACIWMRIVLEMRQR